MTPMIVDIRDAAEFAYGHIPDAVNIPVNGIFTAGLPKERPLLLYCKNGSRSVNIATALQNMGYDAQAIPGGYLGWVTECLNNPEITKQAEQSLLKKFRKPIWCRFTKALNEYQLLQPGDKVAVCISGGKDSMLMAKLFQELKRHDKFPFELEFIVMDPGYSPENRSLIERNAAALSIPIRVFESDIFNSVFHIEKNPCYLCARMRRGHLYHFAQELGCNKIALGHHYDDVIETILMGMLYGAQVQTMMPKLHSMNFPGMELIRPLYLIREDDIKRWRDHNNLHFIQCACKFTEQTAQQSPDEPMQSKRQEIKQLIRTLKAVNSQVEQNIFRSVENVNLSTVIAYKQNGVTHHFLESYGESAGED